MQSSANFLIRLMTKRRRNGQALIIIAAAFLALIAFVGIAVDVTMLFARYSTLRRAVDAAAIAAASHMRTDSNYTTLVSVASQYIKLHGLNATSVKVDTCETEQYDLQQKTGFSGTPLPTILAYAKDRPPYSETNPPPSELCKADPQKILRVSAQIESPTAFLSLFGWKSVTLVASSVSQTAVLDVALVLDTGTAETYDTLFAERNAAEYPCGDGATRDPNNPDNPTCYRPADPNNPNTTGYPQGAIGTTGNADFSSANSDLKYTNTVKLLDFKDFTNGDSPDNPGLGLDPYATGVTTDPNTGNITGITVNMSQKAIRQECWQNFTGDSSARVANYAWAGCCDDPTIQSNPNDATQTNVDHEWTVDPNLFVCDNSDPTKQSTISTNGQCSQGSTPGAKVVGSQDLTNVSPYRTTNPMSGMYQGGDGNFSDLICQPFKQVRDAARNFLNKLDFVRGDRVALVTFDSQASVKTPLGATTKMIANKVDAVRTLNYLVGVEISPNGRQAGCITDDKYPDGNLTNPKPINTYWTIAQCPDTNTGDGIRAAVSTLTDPTWVRRESVWVMVLLSDGYPNRTAAYDPTGNTGIGGPIHSDLALDTSNPAQVVDCSSYAAGLQDKQCPCNDQNSQYADNYGKIICKDSTGYGPTLRPGYQAKPSYGFCPASTYCDPNYASFYDASCNNVTPNGKPVWGSASWSKFNTSDATIPETPLCTSNDPYARHFCSSGDGTINPDPSKGACDPNYDATDYARDMADMAGLLDYNPQTNTKGQFIAMFTIFFSHQSDPTHPRPLNDSVLGIQFMRYVADVGDNGVIDNHLQAWYRAQHNANTGNTAPDRTNYNQNDIPGYKQEEDPCAKYDPAELNLQPDGQPDSPYEKALKTDCGNYWFASDLSKVNSAFTEIAGRLFTRLSR